MTTLQIVIPMAGNSPFFPNSDGNYPKIFSEILGKPMIQNVIENLSAIKMNKRFIFIVKKNDIINFRLDNILKILTNNECEVIAQNGETQGAIFSVLLAIERIDLSQPILISNSDQVINFNLNTIIKELNNFDGGVVTFDSIHPHWSYVRIDNDNFVMEASEKMPISNNAIAGLYFFSDGNDFFQSARNSILKKRTHNGKFYISSTLNEMILLGKSIKAFSIPSNYYNCFYSPEKIKEFETTHPIKRT